MSAEASGGRSRWPERLLGVVGLALLGVGLLLIPLRRLAEDPVHRGITGEVLPELVPSERIEAEPGALAGFNLLVITTDTTRADHLRGYGNQSVRTPTLDGLARQGVLFANAATPSPSTLPAHSSLMTGLYPLHHGARANGTFRLEERVTTLAERLGAAGYRTGAVISAYVLDSRFGLDQGFGLYHDDLTKGVKLSAHMFRERPAELANEPAVEWLRRGGPEPFFLWMHYFDPHAVYLPPEPFRRDYADDPYDGEIAYADSQIGALLSELEALGLREKTLVIYTADHGEGLGEHGEQTHSLLTYDGTLHVPLIVSAPRGLPQGRVIRRQASLVDVVPTALALLGQALPPDLDGVDWTRPPPPGPRPVYFETIATKTLHGWAPLLGIRSEEYKYILAPEPELYDLRADPEEMRNLHDDRPEVVAALRDELVRVVGGDPLVATEVVANLEMDDDMRRQLAALGYVETVGEDAAPRAEIDPKQGIVQWERVQHGINLRAQGRVSEALPILEEAVADVEGDIFARGVLAGIYQMRGDYDRALEIYRRSAELEPKSEEIQLGLASVHLRRGEHDEAEAAIGRALAIEPENAGAYVARGQLALQRRDPEAAMGLFEKARDMDPGTTGPIAWVQIGHLHLRTNRLEEARDAFQAALRLDQLSGPARDGLAQVLIAEDRDEEAVEMLQTALRFDPNQPGALATLASLTSRAGDHEAALAMAQRAIDMVPSSGEVHNALGLIQRRRGELEKAREHYEKAIEHAPYLDKPHVNLAQLLLREGRSEEAFEAFREALRVNPANHIAIANLGAHHFNEGRIDQAFRFYRRALRVDPDYALVHKHIGSIYLLREQPQQALYHLRRSLELDPGQPQAEELRYHIAQAEQAARPAAENGAPAPPRP